MIREAGFTAFRGADPAWHSGLGGPVGRMARYLDHLVALPPPVSVPTEALPRLWNVPGSMLLLHRSGARRWVSLESRVRKARRGLHAAAERGAVFHLWTHPFNLASDPDGLIRVVDRILREAVAMRERGELVIETMSTVAARMEDRSAAPPSEDQP